MSEKIIKELLSEIWEESQMPVLEQMGYTDYINKYTKQIKDLIQSELKQAQEEVLDLEDKLSCIKTSENCEGYNCYFSTKSKKYETENQQLKEKLEGAKEDLNKIVNKANEYSDITKTLLIVEGLAAAALKNLRGENNE